MSRIDGSAPSPPVVVSTPRPVVRVEEPSDEEPPGVPSILRSSLGRLVLALRWTTLVVGLVLSSTAITDGSYRPVWATAICVFLTSWRTMRPLLLGAERGASMVAPLVDAVAFGIAAGVSDGLASPFVFCLLGAAAVATFGWGVERGVVTMVVGAAATVVAALVTNGELGIVDRAGQFAGLGLLFSVGVLAVVRNRLFETEQRRVDLVGRVDALSETNELLVVLNRVARTLPATLDLPSALEKAERQLRETFDPRSILFVSAVPETDGWATVHAWGASAPAHFASRELPWLCDLARTSDGTVVVERLGEEATSGVDGSGLAVALRHGAREVGLLALEHADPGHYDERQAVLLSGLADSLALTIDNAREFDQLRLLAASEERTRIARELHDQLGQWLTFIGLELERLQGQPQYADSEDLAELRSTVSRAVDAFRETLRGLRTTVTSDEPLAVIGREIVESFASHSSVRATFVDRSTDPLPPAIENELLRILQEALNNASQHAAASLVEVTWATTPERGRLTIRDDGRGFDLDASTDGSYGLQGMRERALAIGATLDIESRPGEGTTIQVTTPREVGT